MSSVLRAREIVIEHPVTQHAEQLVRTSSSVSVATRALAAAAGGRRAELEETRDVFIDRLHRDSDDYAATNALRLVYGAIDVVDAENVAEQSPPQPARRWSRRWRAGRRRDAHDRDRDVRAAERAAVVVQPRAADRLEPGVQSPAPVVEGAPATTESDLWALDRAADDGWPAARISLGTPTDELVQVGARTRSR